MLMSLKYTLGLVSLTAAYVPTKMCEREEKGRRLPNSTLFSTRETHFLGQRNSNDMNIESRLRVKCWRPMPLAPET